MKSDIAKLMESWLESRLPATEWQWMQDRLNRITLSSAHRDLPITLGLIPRKLGRDDLAPSPLELAAANDLVNGWDPSQWSIDTVARLLVLRMTAEFDEASFAPLLKDLCQTADLAESITLYSGFSLFPKSEALDAQIGEGLRTNIRAVFEAIAHRNPYPCENFEQNRWNHMVLKALFIGAKLSPIMGLDQRANPELATILIDYAHERWAAKRPVTIELWRCVGPFAEGAMIDDLAKVAASSQPEEHRAGVLALCQSPDPIAATIASKYPETAALVASGELTWTMLDA